MKIIEDGKSRNKWSLIVECTGKDYKQKCKPCHSILELEGADILKRKFSTWYKYGFICPTCNCFTSVDGKLIPEETKKYCKEIANSSNNIDYASLNEIKRKVSAVIHVN